MKQTIRLTTTILALAMVVGGSAAMKAMAQTPDAIDNARSTRKIAAAEAGQPGKQAGTGAPAPAVKPAGHTGVEAGRGEGGGFLCFFFQQPAAACERGARSGRDRD